MSYLSRYRMSVTCSASVATYQTPSVIGGYLEAIRYTKASASGLATGATVYFTAISDIDAIDTSAAHDVLKFTGTSASQILFPRRENQSTAGASAGLGAARIPLAGDSLKLVVESGGANGRGTFDVYVEGRANW